MQKEKTIWFYLCLAVLLVFYSGCMPPPNQEGQQEGGTNVMLKMFGPMIFFFVIMWVLLIRPQQKKQREHDSLVKNLKAGDRVVASGMVATVVTIKDDTVMLRSGDAKLEVLRHAVTEVFKDKPKDK